MSETQRTDALEQAVSLIDRIDDWLQPRRTHYRSAATIARSVGCTEREALSALLALKSRNKVIRNARGAWKAPSIAPSQVLKGRRKLPEPEQEMDLTRWKCLAKWLVNEYVHARPKATRTGEQALLACKLAVVVDQCADQAALCHLLDKERHWGSPRTFCGTEPDGYWAKRLRWVLLHRRANYWGERYQGDRPPAEPHLAIESPPEPPGPSEPRGRLRSFRGASQIYR